MFVKRFFDAISDKNKLDDPITAAVSQAKQEHEVAVATVQQTLCQVLDGKDCECRGLKVVAR